MSRPRWFLIAFWIMVTLPPMAALAQELATHPSAWQVWGEWRRLLSLLKNTSLLVLGVWLICVPVGTAAALILYRSDLPGRKTLRRLLLLALFVPLPVFASAWQATFGSGGWVAVPSWKTADPSDVTTGIPWKPWATGLPSAIWIHAVAAMPWFIWLAGIGFSHVEQGAEDDALVYGGVWQAIRQVTMPRAAPALLAAAAWVGLQCANEVTVTDMMQVRTLAEEVYVQMAQPELANYGTTSGATRGLAVAVPPSLVLCALIGWWWKRWETRLPPLAETTREFSLWKLHGFRWFALALLLLLVLIILGVPLGSLAWRVGHVPPREPWSLRHAVESVRHAWGSQHGTILRSLAGALCLGSVVAVVATWSCWAARDSRLFRRVAFGVALLCLCLPGPVLGIAMKEAINRLVAAEAWVSGGRVRVLFTLLYSGPSPAPVFWAIGLRFISAAIALLWPPVRSIPAEVMDQARLDGAGRWNLCKLVLIPAVLPVACLAWLSVAALALGELSASKLVETPGGQTFAHEVFQQMHYGVDRHLAAMCLLLIASVAGIAAIGWLGRILVLWAWPRWRPASSQSST